MRQWKVVLTNGSVWPVTAPTAFAAMMRLGLNQVVGVEQG